MSFDLPLFPQQTPSYILSFQFSSWYPLFAEHSIKSTVIRPLSQEFCEYLDADSVFIPEGSENFPVESTLSDDDDDTNQDDESDQEQPEKRCYAFPELDQKIRDCLQEYTAIFPKLNFSSPKDASWVLPASSPLKCTAPADVYLLLKSSDFVSHDLAPGTVFEGCNVEGSTLPAYELELVLRKWYPIDKSRELRCFVRGNVLIAISQRDNNHYSFLNELDMQEKIVAAVKSFWESNIKIKLQTLADYTFDFLLTRDLSRGHILDFNPFLPRTDPLLFTYEDLHALYRSQKDIPELRVIDSHSHPVAARNAPAYQHNMVPFEAISISSGHDIEDFSELWRESIKESMQDD